MHTPNQSHYPEKKPLRTTHHHYRTKTHPCVELGSVRPLTAVLPLGGVLPPLGTMHAARVAVGGGLTGAPLVVLLWVLVALRAVVLVAVVFVLVIAVAAGMERLVFLDFEMQIVHILKL